MITKDKPLIVGVVGPCGSGKSTLISTMRQALVPYRIYHIAQEHSYVMTMWQRLVHPDILIFLDASFEVTIQRKNLDWTQEDYQEQHRRLSNARENANLYIQTDHLTSQEVMQQVIQFLISLAPD